jgi:hypothetical protein
MIMEDEVSKDTKINNTVLFSLHLIKTLNYQGVLIRCFCLK